MTFTHFTSPVCIKFIWNYNVIHALYIHSSQLSVNCSCSILQDWNFEWALVFATKKCENRRWLEVNLTSLSCVCCCAQRQDLNDSIIFITYEYSLTTISWPLFLLCKTQKFSCDSTSHISSFYRGMTLRYWTISFFTTQVSWLILTWGFSVPKFSATVTDELSCHPRKTISFC